jgi:hypothetical protein
MKKIGLHNVGEAAFARGRAGFAAFVSHGTRMFEERA